MTVESFLIVADEIHALAGAGTKTMAVGIYADRNILLQFASNHQEGFTPAMAKLHMMVTMWGLPTGVHDAQAEIVFPDGTPGPRSRPMQINVLPEQAATVILGFVPCPMPQEGRYLLRLNVAQNTVENHFTVSHVDMTPEPAATERLPFGVSPTVAAAASAFKRGKPTSKEATTPAGSAAKRAASPVTRPNRWSGEPAARQAPPKAGKKKQGH